LLAGRAGWARGLLAAAGGAGAFVRLGALADRVAPASRPAATCWHSVIMLLMRSTRLIPLIRARWERRASAGEVRDWSFGAIVGRAMLS
jgi:hypothetical protein